MVDRRQIEELTWGTIATTIINSVEYNIRAEVGKKICSTPCGIIMDIILTIKKGDEL